MHGLRIAVATRTLRQPIRTAINTAARIGSQGVQFDARYELKPDELGETGRRQLLHELRERDLTVASLVFPLRSALADSEQLDQRMAALRKGMEFASRLKANVLTCAAGRLPPEDATDECQQLHAVLSDLARYGNHIGVTLSITPAGHDTGRLVALLKDINEGPLGIDFDPAGCVLSRENPASILRELHASATHIQIRDALSSVDGNGREVPVGRGEVDWELILALVDEMNYRGWLTVLRTEGDDRIGDCTRAVAYLKNVLNS